VTFLSAARTKGDGMGFSPYLNCGGQLLLLTGLLFVHPQWTSTANSGFDQGVTPLKQAHAHNDYEHKRPLFDALDQGFCSVEADIFLVDDQLLVGHTKKDLTRERTLEKLYLDPLRERIKAHGGKVYAGGPTVFLLIDVKTEAKATYAVLAKVLTRYSDILSVARGDKFEAKAVTAVISGNCDRQAIIAQKERFAAIDGRPSDLDSDTPAHLIPWISASWGSLFKWKGEGPIPEAELAKLREITAKAHKHGRLVRFWATPENPVVWDQLLSGGVDLLNTDQLPEMRKFLTSRTHAK
jgi:Glycerophosphoryl diester phosphodiesterase family